MPGSWQTLQSSGLCFLSLHAFSEEGKCKKWIENTRSHSLPFQRLEFISVLPSNVQPHSTMNSILINKFTKKKKVPIASTTCILANITYNTNVFLLKDMRTYILKQTLFKANLFFLFVLIAFTRSSLKKSLHT